MTDSSLGLLVVSSCDGVDGMSDSGKIVWIGFKNPGLIQWLEGSL